MPPIHTQQKFAAALASEARGLLPTTLGSRELRGAIAEDVRARSVFCARGANLVFLSRVKELIDAEAAGEMDRATVRWQIKEILATLGYTPERGFPDDVSGDVPPAVKGTLQDLSSDQRINLIIDTQIKLMQGRGQQLRGMQPDELANFPAWELIRVSDRQVPRDWPARWTVAGGVRTAGRMIALKGSPVWGELGNSGNFDDALDVDYPPFAFNSGMGWEPLTREECARLGITGPDGESIDEWLANDHPVLNATQAGLPAPQISTANLDPALVSEFLKQTGAVQVEQTATPAANRETLLAQLEARRLAREARMNARLAKSIADRQREYAAR